MKRLNISWETREGAGCLILYGVTILKLFSRRQDLFQNHDESLIWLKRKSSRVVSLRIGSSVKLVDKAERKTGTSEQMKSKGSFTKLNAALELTIGRIVARGNRILEAWVVRSIRWASSTVQMNEASLPTSCPPVARRMTADAVAPIDAVLQRISGRDSTDKNRALRIIDFFCDSDSHHEKKSVLCSNHLIGSWEHIISSRGISSFSTTNLDEKVNGLQDAAT